MAVDLKRHHRLMVKGALGLAGSATLYWFISESSVAIYVAVFSAVVSVVLDFRLNGFTLEDLNKGGAGDGPDGGDCGGDGGGGD